MNNNQMKAKHNFRLTALVPAWTFLACVFLSSVVLAGDVSDCRIVMPDKPDYVYVETNFWQFPRRYADLTPAQVAKCAEHEFRTAVRFKDTVVDTADNKGLMRRIASQIYMANIVLVTEGGLHVAVPKFHYTPWLDEVNRRAEELKPGDEFIVEGLVGGMVDERRTIYVDRILTLKESRSHISYNLTVTEPGAKMPLVELNCPGAADSTLTTREGDSVNVSIEAELIDYSQLLSWSTNRLFGKPPAEESLVYQSIGSGPVSTEEEGVPVASSFRLWNISLPDSDFKELTTPSGITIPVGALLRAHEGIVCLIPSGDSVLIERATRLTVGQDVTVEGVTVRLPDNSMGVLVHDVWLKDLPARHEQASACRVTLSIEGEPDRCLWEIGDYRFRLAGDDEEQAEELLVTLRERRHPGNGEQP